MCDEITIAYLCCIHERACSKPWQGPLGTHKERYPQYQGSDTENEAWGLTDLRMHVCHKNFSRVVDRCRCRIRHAPRGGVPFVFTTKAALYSVCAAMAV